MRYEAVLEKIDNLTDDITEWQRNLTSIPALGPNNGGQGELEKTEYIKSIVQGLSPDEVITVKAPDDRVECGYRPNLIALFKGKNRGGKVWILSHTDIVPPGDRSLWDGDPFEMRIDGDLLIGRGVEDNQHGIVSSLAALTAIRELNVDLPRDVGLVFVADEETGNYYGLDFVLKQRRDLFSENDLIIVPDAGNEDGTMIEVAEKSILWMKILVLGKQCHASMPQKGNNSLRAAASMIVALEELYTEFDYEDLIFSPPKSTFEPTKKEANVPNINTVPGSDIFYIDCRVLPKYQLDLIKEAIQRICGEVADRRGVQVDFEIVIQEQAAPPTPSNAPIVVALKDAIREIYGREAKPMGIGGGTVAAFFRKAGLPAAVWSTCNDTAHQPNEYVSRKKLLDDAKVFAHVILRS